MSGLKKKFLVVVVFEHDKYTHSQSFNASTHFKCWSLSDFITECIKEVIEEYNGNISITKIEAYED